MRTTLVFILIAVVTSLPARSEQSQSRCIRPSTEVQTAPSREAVAGHYEAVSESEWNLEVWLRPDGTAAVLSEGWHAGDHEKRSTDRYSGTWSLSGTFVELRYGERCETLQFSPILSFAEFGAQGAAPGLQGQHSSVPHNLFIGRSLWRTEYLEKLPNVE